MILTTIVFFLVLREWCIEKWYYQGCGTSIDKLMLGTSRYHHEVSSFDVLILAGYRGFANSGSESQGLVDGVDL